MHLQRLRISFWDAVQGRRAWRARAWPRRAWLGVVCAAACLMLEAERPAAANEVTDWNNELLLVFQQTSGNLVMGPPEVARDIAIAGNAMMDAVNAATGSTLPYTAYSGGAVAGANSSVAAASAAYTALYGIFTNAAWQTPISQVTGVGSDNSNVVLANSLVLPELKSFLDDQLSALGLPNPAGCSGSSSSLCAGYTLGVAAGNAITAARAQDGAVQAIQKGLLTYTPPGSGTTPGVYVPPATRPAMYPTWGTVEPFGMTSAQLAEAQSKAPGPPPLTSTTYSSMLLQTECQGSKAALGTLPQTLQAACAAAGYTQRTTRQANSALFWNDPGTTIQPPGHWLQIADTVLEDQDSSLLESAEISALLGDAETDAGIAAWSVKYANNLWRPITAINDCVSSGGGIIWTNPNCAPGWTSLIVTPPHPDYVAGHPAFSGAAAVVLADAFGTNAIDFDSTSDYYCNGGTSNFDTNGLVVSCTLNGKTWYVANPSDCADIVGGVIIGNSPLICPITESFLSFTDASSGVDGASDSRIWGGIHTPFAVSDGLAIGNAIGEIVSANAGLPEVVPEPSALLALLLPGLALTATRQRKT